MEGDKNGQELYNWERYHFNPLPPHGGRHIFKIVTAMFKTFQSTPSAWRETSVPIRRMGTSPISIHSLRMEGDELSQYNFGGIGHFNPLPPHGGRRNLDTGQASIYYFNPLPPHGGRPCSCTYSFIVLEFQSTPSAWRETDTMDDLCDFMSISIHSLRMEGDCFINISQCFIIISIHSLRMEGDPKNFYPLYLHCYFNPLPPHGGRRIS